jgi:hypothetical protein
MATNESRSLNQSMADGATDGKYRKARPNTTVNSEEANKVNPVGDTAVSRARKYPVFDIDSNQMGANY